MRKIKSIKLKEFHTDYLLRKFEYLPAINKSGDVSYRWHGIKSVHSKKYYLTVYTLYEGEPLFCLNSEFEYYGWGLEKPDGCIFEAMRKINYDWKSGEIPEKENQSTGYQGV